MCCKEGPWSWVTSHTFHKTVATRLDEAGLTLRQVADPWSHANPSMTLDVYFGRQVARSPGRQVARSPGRQVVSAVAARVLGR
jgi:integrase